MLSESVADWIVLPAGTSRRSHFKRIACWGVPSAQPCRPVAIGLVGNRADDPPSCVPVYACTPSWKERVTAARLLVWRSSTALADKNSRVSNASKRNDLGFRRAERLSLRWLADTCGRRAIGFHPSKSRQSLVQIARLSRLPAECPPQAGISQPDGRNSVHALLSPCEKRSTTLVHKPNRSSPRHKIRGRLSVMKSPRATTPVSCACALGKHMHVLRCWHEEWRVESGGVGKHGDTEDMERRRRRRRRRRRIGTTKDTKDTK